MLATIAPQLDADTCIEYIVLAEGNLDLAAERLTTTYDYPLNTIKPSHLVASIARDPTASANLQAQLRTITLLNTLVLQQETTVVLREQLTALEPADAAKFFTALTTTMAALTAPSQTPDSHGDLPTEVLKHLNPQVRQAFKTMLLAQAGINLTDETQQHAAAQALFKRNRKDPRADEE